MPTYEFQCANCGHIFEQRRSFAQSDAPAMCPKCSATNAKRLITGGAGFFRPMTPGEIGTSEYNYAQRSVSRMAERFVADNNAAAAEAEHDHHDHDHAHEPHEHHDHAAEAHHHDEPHEHAHHDDHGDD